MDEDHCRTAYLSPKCSVVENERIGGKAVVANEYINQGDVVAVWSGRILTYDQIRGLPEAFRAHTAQVEEGLYLTSITPEEAPDYINHSCEPSCGMSGQLVIVAMRDINAGEEITIDYAMCDGSAFDEFPCACGSRLCRGEVTGNDWRRPELWARYGAHFSPYLLRRINALRAPGHKVRHAVANGRHADV